MSLYDVILKELDLNEGDEFLIRNDMCVARKFENGRFISKECKNSDWVNSQTTLNTFIGFQPITITKRAPWVPKVGEEYYIPTPERTILWDGTRYDADDYDLLMIKRGMAFKTQKEAEDCAKKMLDAIKGDG